MGALYPFEHIQRHLSLASPQHLAMEHEPDSLFELEYVKCLTLPEALVLVTLNEERCLPAGLAVPQTLPH